MSGNLVGQHHSLTLHLSSTGEIKMPCRSGDWSVRDADLTELNMNRMKPAASLLLVWLCCTVTLFWPTPATAAPRTWSDASGKFKIEANMIGVEEGVVILQRTDNGKTVRIPIGKLSAADRKYLAENGAIPKAVEPEKKPGETKPAESPTKADPSGEPPQETPSNPPGKTASSAEPGKTAKAEPPKLGEYRIELEELPIQLFLDVQQRSHLQTNPIVLDQVQKGQVKGMREKDGLKPSWQVYVPDAYLPDTPHGVLVYINAADTGNVQADWKAVLDKHKLIWVGANDSGNDHDTNWRHSLALQGLREVQARYTLDADRVYVCGVSGGGRAASLIMLMYADVFTGGFPHVGCNPYRELPLADGTFLPAQPNLTTPTLFELAKRRNRYVFLTGDTDFNREQTQGVFGQYQADGFAFVSYLQVPEMAHSSPNAEWFEKGIVALDAPLAAQASTAFTKATADHKRSKLGAAFDGFRRAFSHGGEQAFVAEAREKYLELQKQYQTELAALQAQIDANELATISPKIATFRKQWAPAADADVAKLLEEVKVKRKK